MIARAACAALAILVGSLASSRAAAQSPPSPEPSAARPPEPPASALEAPSPASERPSPSLQPPPSSLQPPPLLPGLPPVPAGYVPWPLIFRDGAWRPFGAIAEVDPSAPPAGDPLYPTGITLGIGGLLTTALGVGLLVGAGSLHHVCGLSGCLGLPDREAQNYGAAVLAGGATAAIFGGATAYFSGKGPPSARRSNPRTVVGAVFTTVGVSVAASGLMNAANPYRNRVPIAGEVFPPGEFVQQPYTTGATLIFTLVSATFLAVGLPLWITGAAAPRGGLRSRDAENRLDLVPSAGGAALRWTR